MATEIGERIKVLAVFDGGGLGGEQGGGQGEGGGAGESGVRPVKFRWRGRLYPVDEITYTWRTREGNADIVHFSVTDGATLYELAYNLSTMGWSLEQVEA
ncbi:MAG: hypothetical protein ACE5D4_05430 [Thermodesulfobacteriota bacterium]